MGWVIVFVISWVLFVILADMKQLKYNVWVGFVAIALQLLVDYGGTSRQFYTIEKPVLRICCSSAFFTFGPVFTVGVLIAQYHPAKRWMRLLNILILASLYTVQEILLLNTGELRYMNWTLYDSVVVNICAMIIFSWVTVCVIRKNRRRI